MKIHEYQAKAILSQFGIPESLAEIGITTKRVLEQSPNRSQGVGRWRKPSTRL